MSILRFDDLPEWAMAASLAANFAAGAGVGLVYFRVLWWQAQLFATRRATLPMILLILGRFAILAGALALASLEGALPLLAAALGVLVARAAVMRSVRRAPT